MSVLINVIGSKPKSDEYQCAVKLKRILEDGLPKNAMGEIVLHANATLVGQTVKDIDLLAMGTLQNCSMNLSITDKNSEISNENIIIDSFCTCIEIKSHSINGIFREGTEVYVKYGAEQHSVTTQSNEQKISAKNFFSRILGGFSPYVSNLIWLNGITKDELDSLLKIEGKIMPSNILSCEFEVKHFMQLLMWQKSPSFYRGNYHFDSCFAGKTVKDFQNALSALGKAKSCMGELTRKRIEQITQKAISSNLTKLGEDKLVIYRGKAGTGKTVGLIQTAIDLVDEFDARVVILTYNKALVSDIRRLFTLAELPDMFQDSCVHICTMHSFFYRIINSTLYDGNLSGEKFINNYQALMVELLELFSDSDGKQLIDEILSKDTHLNWEYCLVDEAQDWSQVEMDVLLQLFSIDKIIVADGGQQFVRNEEVCDWSTVSSRKNVKLKYCLRQKNNIVNFINHYLNSIGESNQKILTNDKLAGGRIVITQSDNSLIPMIKDELLYLKKYGNIPYDMIVFVPSSYVEKSPRRFSQKSLFEKNDITIWDGTNEEERENYSLLGDDVRVLQYESGRGLEAWVVICVDFDEYIQEKISQFDNSKSTNKLLLESEDDLKLKHLVNWSLIPLTRAIDTVVITIKNPTSKTATILKRIAEENPDYITIK